MKIDISQQVGCGYCFKEKEYKIRDSKVNKAKQGCVDFKHWNLNES